MALQNVLNEQHFEQIKAGIEAAQTGLAQVAMAKQAGIDLKAQEEQLKSSLDQLQRIRQVYFPGR